MPALNTPLKQLDTETLRKLAHVQGPCVTIQMPDSQPGASAVRRTALLRQLTQQAIESLGNMSRTARTESLGTALEAFVETVDHGGGPGLTLFVAPGLESVFVTPGVKPSAVASPHFHLLPLLTAAAAPKDFFALGISRKIIRLWRVTPLDCEEVVLPHSVPSSLEVSGAVDHPDHNIQNRSTVGSPGMKRGNGKVNSMRFGTVSEYDSEAEYLHHFFSQVAKGLRDVVQEFPVFLIGTHPDILEYRKAAHGVDLFSSEWHANPAHCTVAEVEAEARLAALKEVYAKAEAAIRQLPELRERLETDPALVAKAASEGRVHQLFIAEEAPITQPKDEEISGAPVRQPGQRENILNAAAVEALRTGATIMVTPGTTLPAGAPAGTTIAAILRF